MPETDAPMNDKQRADLAVVLHRVTMEKFDSKKRAAYSAAGVSPATWDRALEGLRLRADRLHAVVKALWPDTNGDWTKLLDGHGNVDIDIAVTSARPTVDGSSQVSGDGDYVMAPGERRTAGVDDNAVLRAIEEMRREQRAMSERLERLERERDA